MRRLDKAFGAFFRRLKAGETPGFPRFKGRDRFNSLEYRYGDGCKLRGDDRDRVRFYVQNVGAIPFLFVRYRRKKQTARKQEALRLVETVDKSVSELVQEPGLSHRLIRQWRQQYQSTQHGARLRSLSFD